jgi:hypothetical protein
MELSSLLGRSLGRELGTNASQILGRDRVLWHSEARGRTQRNRFSGGLCYMEGVLQPGVDGLCRVAKME